MKTKSKKFYYHFLSAIKEEIIQELQEKIFASEIKKEGLDEPMTLKEIAEYYKIHPSTVNRYLKQGLRSQSKGEKCKRFFTKNDFNIFLERNKKTRIHNN